MNTKATAVGVAALINKAQKLHKQSDALIKQAQSECKHPDVEEWRRKPEDTSALKVCMVCGKRWVE